MAQLPPKIPSMAQNWPNSFHHHQKLATMASFATQQQPQQQQQQPCWVDEFLDFTATRRGAHRRSASDSIAFLESPLVEECRNSAALMMMHGSFDRLDDDQLMSMFSDDVSSAQAATAAAASNPSTPSSDQNSNNNNNNNNENDNKLFATMSLDHNQQQQQQPKSEPGDVEDSPSEGEDHAPPLNFSAAGTVSSGDTIFDPKRVKRILANRQSAQRSRVRKLQYISELERSVTTLQSEVSALSPRVAFLDHQRLILNVDNSALKQRIAALAQDKIFKDAHQEALKNEIERLRQVYHQQNIKKMENHHHHPQNAPSPTQNSDAAGDCTDNGAL
ncbi:basic leucine zipper 34-like [Humulus lupulus]|uniref:basic leucine zipper 34-like n=1 Tax=Humulus lupulus TaxID=3486 RepID=UPI002B41353E|nr:basic leucine zipper 34-like [Humulus lupulus]